jgi:hypothetical protein
MAPKPPRTPDRRRSSNQFEDAVESHHHTTPHGQTHERWGHLHTAQNQCTSQKQANQWPQNPQEHRIAGAPRTSSKTPLNHTITRLHTAKHMRDGVIYTQHKISEVERTD